MKKFLVVFLIVALCVSFAACGSGGSETATSANTNASSSTTTGTSGEKAPIIGLAMGVADVSQQRLANNIKKGCEARGYTVYLTYAGDSILKQISDVEDLVTKQCDLIFIMAADYDACVPAVEAVKNAGKICVVGRDVNTDKYDALATFVDNYKLGYLEGQYAAENFFKKNPDKQYYVGYMSGSQANIDAVIRLNGTKDGLNDSGCTNWEWVVDNDGDFVTETAQSIADAWAIAHPEINCVITGSDDMALGVYNAFLSAGLTDDLILIGIDGNESGLHLIEEGEMTCTYATDVMGALVENLPLFFKELIDGDTSRLNEKKEFMIGDESFIICIDSPEKVVAWREATAEYNE